MPMEMVLVWSKQGGAPAPAATGMWHNLVSAASSHMDLEGVLGKRPRSRGGKIG
jgi:hypothetical protein